MTTTPPSGTVTFLFTDIEGSTMLWEARREAMAAALAHHDALLRAAVDAHHGFVFATGGDGFAAAFGRAGDAVLAAAEAQEAFANAAWPDELVLLVRMALHTGEAEERDGNYFGEPVNRTARLMDAAAGGQVLLSSSAAAVVQGLLRSGLTLFDHGYRRLRSLSSAEHVFELVLPGATPRSGVRAEELGLSPATSSRIRLIGRDSDARTVAGLLDSAALVTLTGVGGVGKTSLAMEVAGRVADRFPDGVRVAELASVTSSDQVPEALAELLSMRPQAATSPIEAVLRGLAQQDVLLVLDNCEHVVDVVGDAVAAITRRCPTVRLLATSREALGVRGERTFNVRPLSVDDGVRLFEARLADHQGGFDSMAATAPGELAALCRQLDGLPLAIELAAARARSMSLGDLGSRLGERFRLLRGPRTAAARHQTLRQTVAWSYDLLTMPEQRLFDRLAVFSGGFTLAAAEAVCADSDWDEMDVDELVAALADKSMVVADHDGRYMQLETLRQFGQERLQAAGLTDGVRDRHLAFFVRFTAAAHDGLQSEAEGKWWRRLADDWANIRSAFNWALSIDRIDDAATIAVNLTWAANWHDTGEPYAWVATVAKHPGTSSSPLAPSVYAANAWAAWEREELHAALSWGRRALDAEQLGTPSIDYYAEIAIMSAHDFLGDAHEAHHYLDRAVERARKDGRITLEAVFTTSRTIHANTFGGPDDALTVARRARQLAGVSKNPTALGWAMANEAATIAGTEPSAAIALLEDTLDLAVANDLGLVAWWAQFLLAVQFARGRQIERAAELLVDGLAQMRRKSSWMFARQTLVEAAHVLHLIGRDELAATIHGALRTSSVATHPLWARRIATARLRLERSLGSERAAELATSGENVPIEQAVRVAEEALRAWSQAHSPGVDAIPTSNQD